MSELPDKRLSLLVVGSGGREHALVWKLAQSPRVDRIFCAPGNPGIASAATCIDIAANEVTALREFARETGVDLTIVGPEAPLVAGIVDEFEAHGMAIFGPSRLAAMLEGSKIYAKRLMQQYHIPTARFAEFDHFARARDHVLAAAFPVVIKADGLAAGKGAVVVRHREEALLTLERMMLKKEFGDSGAQVVIEEFMEGEEVSVLALTDGANVLILPPAQDHKAIFDNDEGPNTGGMGAYAPAPVLTPSLLTTVCEQILEPAIRAMAEEGRPYRGVLYAGLMVTKDGPKVVEFNCRFGDPETEVILPLIESDLAEAMWRVAQGDIREFELKLSPRWAVGVVMASGGYPAGYQTGKAIIGLDRLESRDLQVFHAGTALDAQQQVVTSGGRVLVATGMGDSFGAARQRAYAAVSRITFDGAYYRKDIGAKALRHLMA